LFPAHGSAIVLTHGFKGTLTDCLSAGQLLVFIEVAADVKRRVANDAIFHT
jgi:hypothetical protein